MAAVLQHFAPLLDPRMSRTRRHSLNDILTIAMSGMICGVDTWVDLVEFANERLAWFKTFLELPNGIPSHDTFGRVFSALAPDEFSRCVSSWVKSLPNAPKNLEVVGEMPEVVAIDGKTLRRSFDRAAGVAGIHMVSAWATAAQLVLGQVKTDADSNEITAIPKLLETVSIEGTIVTIDAMGAQKEIVKDIVERGGEYVISLKANQPALFASVQSFFAQAQSENFVNVNFSYIETIEKDHGRIETRKYWSSSDVDGLETKNEWYGLASIGMVESTRCINNETSIHKRFFISSLVEADAKKFSHAVRSHWGIENNLHWVLDVAFDEDHCRIRKNNAPENVAMMRHMALNLLKADDTVRKVGIKIRRNKARRSNQFLLHILGVECGYDRNPPRGAREVGPHMWKKFRK